MHVVEVSKSHTLDINAGTRIPGVVQRTPGLHLSDILRHIGIKLKLITPDEPIEDLDYFVPPGSSIVDLAAINRISAGLAWEHWLGLANPQIQFHLGEIEKDGILMSPDGLEYGTSAPAFKVRLMSDAVIVHEFKFTWKSSKHALESFVLWIMQLKSYCLAIGTNFAKLHVYHVNGNYAGYVPQFRVYAITFTDKELNANWAMITNHAKKHRAEIMKLMAA